MIEAIEPAVPWAGRRDRHPAATRAPGQLRADQDANLSPVPLHVAGLTVLVVGNDLILVRFADHNSAHRRTEPCRQLGKQVVTLDHGWSPELDVVGDDG